MATVTATGTGSPITVAGLTPGKWTFTVSASTAHGIGPVSGASAPTTVSATGGYFYSPLATTRQWLAGYTAGDMTASGQQAFASAYGYTPQVVGTYTPGLGSFGALADWINQYPTVAKAPATNSPTSINDIAMGLLFNNSGMGSTNGPALQNAANGGDVAGWEQVGAALASSGFNYKSTVIRLGWEMNGNWYQWGTGGDPTLMGYFQQAWQHAVTAMRNGGATNVRFHFCLDTLDGGTGAIAGHYPGDSYVDIVGFDYYGNSDTESGLTNNQGAPSFNDVPAFAHAHGKQFAVGEWGPAGGRNTDYPAVIQFMYDNLTALNAQYGNGFVSHDIYFNEFDATHFYALSDNPNCAARYTQLWSAK